MCSVNIPGIMTEVRMGAVATSNNPLQGGQCQPCADAVEYADKNREKDNRVTTQELSQANDDRMSQCGSSKMQEGVCIAYLLHRIKRKKAPKASKGQIRYKTNQGMTSFCFILKVTKLLFSSNCFLLRGYDEPFSWSCGKVGHWASLASAEEPHDKQCGVTKTTFTATGTCPSRSTPLASNTSIHSQSMTVSKGEPWWQTIYIQTHVSRSDAKPFTIHVSYLPTAVSPHQHQSCSWCGGLTIFIRA